MDAGKLQQVKKKTESVYTNSLLEHKMRKLKITQLLQKGKFLGARTLPEKKMPGGIGGCKLRDSESSRARLTLWVLEIVLQDDESKEGLQHLSSKEASRARMLSMTEREVACGGSGPIVTVNGQPLGFLGLSVPTEPIESLRVLNKIGISGKHYGRGPDQSALWQTGAIGKSQAFHNFAVETDCTKE